VNCAKIFGQGSGFWISDFGFWIEEKDGALMQSNMQNIQNPKSKIESLAAAHGCHVDEVAAIIVDHGSRRDDSNQLLLEVARHFEQVGLLPIVEPAHMELEEPSMATAFDRCVARGARLVIISPFFLLPGRHWTEDIPALAAEAASKHTGVKHLVAAPLGPHPLLVDILLERIAELDK